MKKKRVIWASGVALSLLLACSILGFGLSPYSPPKRNCFLNDTIVSHNSFPEGTWGTPFQRRGDSLFALPFFTEEREISSSFRVFSTLNGKAVNETLRYRTSALARKKYTSRLNNFESEPIWFIPPEVGFESQVANEFFFACFGQEYRLGRSCQAIGLYEEYIIYLSVNMVETEDYELFENLLWEIDGRMVACLEIHVSEYAP